MFIQMAHLKYLYIQTIQDAGQCKYINDAIKSMRNNKIDKLITSGMINASSAAGSYYSSTSEKKEVVFKFAGDTTLQIRYDSFNGWFGIQRYLGNDKWLTFGHIMLTIDNNVTSS